MANIFSKAWKGIKKTFKKIGKGIKSGFAKFGKFMNKFGIAGQIGMMFIMPGIGAAMAKGFGTILSGLGSVAAGGGALSGVASAAQTVLGAAGNFARLVAKPFTTITDGVTSFLSNTTKYLGNKLGIKTAFTASGPTSFLGSDGVIGKVGEGISKNLSGFGDIARDLVTGDISAFTPQPASIAQPDDPASFDQSYKENLMTESATPKKQSILGKTKDKFIEEFSPEALTDKAIQGGVDVVETKLGQEVGLLEKPQDYKEPDLIRPQGQFQSDQSTLAIGLQPVTYGGFVSGITEGNPNNIGYGGSQSYNAWMQRATAPTLGLS